MGSCLCIFFRIMFQHFPNLLKPRAPNEPTTPATGKPRDDVAKAVPEDTAPAAPRTQLVPKHTLANGFGEQ